MHFEEHHGIRVVRADLPGPFYGALLLRMGTQDDSFLTPSVSHIVEHLACSTIPRDHLDFNGTVDSRLTCFDAVGDPADVARFLTSIARALTDLPTERLALELRVIAAERGMAVWPPLAWAAPFRYGLTGPGMAGGDVGAPIEDLTAEAVTAHADRHALRDNAVLVLSGPAPDGLDVRLPDGPVPPPAAVHRVDLPLPARATLESTAPAAVLTLELPSEPTASFALEILRRRAEELLRHEWGIAYAVTADNFPLPDGRLAGMGVEVRAEDVARAADGMLSVLRALATEGPTEEELARERRIAHASLAEPDAPLGELQLAGRAAVMGGPVLTIGDLARGFDAVTADQVRVWLRDAQETLLLGLSEGAQDLTADVAALTDLDEYEADDVPVEGTVYKRIPLLPGAPRDLRIVVGEAGLSSTMGGVTTTARWDELVGVGRSGDDRVLVLRDNRVVPVLPAALRHGKRLIEEIDARTAHLQFRDTTTG